jgi:hypothetical protein
MSDHSIAIVIAAQMRVSMPKASQAHPAKPVNVKHALKNAANSSPAAKAAFKRAAPAVKAATPHLKALTQPGKGLMSQLRHGASAMHSLRKVTREMAKAQPSPSSPAKSTPVTSPAAAAALKSGSPAAAKAQKHIDALSSMQASPKPSLLSSLGHGIQAMRALRQATKETRGASGFAPIATGGDAAHSMQTLEKTQSTPAHSTSAKAIDHHDLIAQLRQQLIAAHSGHADAKGSASPHASMNASGQFALMLIARRDSSALSAFKKKA